MNKNKNKEVVIIAGANGSGKTTFARQFLQFTNYVFLNADDIASEINPTNPLRARIQAGKKVISLIDLLIKQNKSFVIESTLSGLFLEKYIRKLKKCGYEISITFIFLGSQKLCIERIKSRILRGGHSVPEEDVKRRYNRGLSRFWYCYRFLANYISIVFNNEYYDFKRIAYGKHDCLEIIDKALYDIFLTQVKEVSNGN